MELSFSTFKWLLETVIVPGSAFLLNVGFRYDRGIPISSGSDLVLLLIVYSGSIAVDPAILQGLTSPELRDDVGTIHFAFLIATILCWFISVAFVEKRLNDYYKAPLTGATEVAVFPYFSWLMTWSLSLTIVVVYLFVIGS
ncbi:MAG: hypothetical protein AWT59_3220 [Candidatus Gallionella acididurans]|uniref:Uncharacterized protein n=1 Tax=Candidatus Gallionella acididurans TaxID=1796491 RepID=A0A139BPN2_9PROT|nr:MAG: hypothetical protein AWT59_3220 [Candidatus Gallionella acididurans]